MRTPASFSRAAAKTVSKKRGSSPPPPPALSIVDDILSGATFAQFRAAVSSARRDLADGAFARALSIVALYPLDATKARMQVSTASSRRAVTAAASPLAARYNGVMAAVLGQVPYGAITFGTFEVAREEMDRRYPDMRPGKRVIIAACIADLVGSLWLAPAEVLKCKVQAGVYGSVGQAIQGTLKSGGVAALWQGFPAQALRDMPFRALQIAAYGKAKEVYLDKVKPKLKKSEGVNRRGGARGKLASEMSKGDAVLVGAVVGGFVGAVTTPLDVVKTRLMSQRSGVGMVYGNWASCVKKSVKAEGVTTLFRGMLPRVVYMAASVAVFSVGYEASRNYMTEKKLLWHADVAAAKGDRR